MKKLQKKSSMYGRNPGLVVKPGTKPTYSDIEHIEEVFGKTFPQDPEQYAKKVLEYAAMRRGLIQSLERIRIGIRGVKS